MLYWPAGECLFDASFDNKSITLSIFAMASLNQWDMIGDIIWCHSRILPCGKNGQIMCFNIIVT